MYVQRGAAYFFKKQHDRALADLNQAIRFDCAEPGKPNKLRGGILLALNRRDQAIADFRKALELGPADESVKQNLKELGGDAVTRDRRRRVARRDGQSQIRISVRECIAGCGSLLLHLEHFALGGGERDLCCRPLQQCSRRAQRRPRVVTASKRKTSVPSCVVIRAAFHFRPGAKDYLTAQRSGPAAVDLDEPPPGFSRSAGHRHRASRSLTSTWG